MTGERIEQLNSQLITCEEKIGNVARSVQMCQKYSENRGDELKCGYESLVGKTRELELLLDKSWEDTARMGKNFDGAIQALDERDVLNVPSISFPSSIVSSLLAFIRRRRITMICVYESRSARSTCSQM